MWFDIFISLRVFQFVVFHTVEAFSVVNETEDVFLEFSCFFNDPIDIGNLISGSSAFSIWDDEKVLEMDSGDGCTR